MDSFLHDDLSLSTVWIGVVPLLVQEANIQKEAHYTSHVAYTYLYIARRICVGN